MSAVPKTHSIAENLPSDEELVVRALDDDGWAQEAIFRRHVQDVFRLVKRLHAGHDIEDIVQDTFADAFSSLDRLREPAALRSWIFGIAIRRVRRAQRKRSLWRQRFVPNAEAALSACASERCTPEQMAELEQVDRLLLRVKPAVRFAWVLRRVQGERLTDIATMLDTSLATVKRRIAHVDARLERQGLR